MNYILSPHTVLRPEEQGALFFHRKTAETLELDIDGLNALECLIKGKKRWSFKHFLFRNYLYCRDFIRPGVNLHDRETVWLCIDKACRVKNPLRSLLAPEALHIAITDSCEQVCGGCFYSRPNLSGKVSRMALPLYQNIIQQAVEHQVLQVALGGGEPLEHPDIIAMVREAACQGLVVNLTTNGNRLTSDMAYQLQMAGLGQLQLSMNGATEAIHRLTRPNFNKLQQAIDTCMKVGLRWGLNVMVTRHNFAELEAIMNIANQRQAYSVNLLRPKPSMKGSPWLQRNQTNNEENRQLQRLIRIWSRRGTFLLTTDASLAFVQPGTVKQRQRSGIVGCTAGRRMLSIFPDGSIYPCGHLRISDTKAGDFMTAWHSSAILERFRKLEDTLEGACKTCELRDSCKGCRAIVFAETGTFHGEDKACPKQLFISS